MISEIPEHCILKIGVAGGNFTLRLLGISGLTAEDSSHIVRFLQSQTIPISNPYAVTCLPRKELQAMFSGFCDTNPAPFPARFSLCSVMFELCDMVVRVGLAPTLFLMWQIYSLLRSLLSHLTFKFGWSDGTRTRVSRIKSSLQDHFATLQ